MLSLQAQKREIRGKKAKKLRQQGIVPAIVYGPALKQAVLLQVLAKDFEKLFSQTGESALFQLVLADKAIPVLVHEVVRDPLKDTISHIDFYSPSLTKKIEATIPLVFIGHASAVKELGGTLVKNISEVQVKALAQNLPHDIKIDVSGLKTFNDYIRIADLPLPPGVEILHRGAEEIIAHVLAPQKVEEELAKPIEEKVEEVARVAKPEKKEKETAQAAPSPETSGEPK